MRKVNLFRLVVLFASVSWLELLGISPSIRYAGLILIIQMFMSILYHLLKDDEENDDNGYKPYRFDN